MSEGVAELPPPQARALAGALALGRAEPGDHFTLYAATLSILAWAATRRPVLITVNDPAWLDRSSQQAILFACRRLVPESIVVLIASRSEPKNLFTTSDLPRMELTGLSPEQAARLIRTSRGDGSTLNQRHGWRAVCCPARLLWR